MKNVKLVIDVNKNQTKKGIKIQIVLPEGVEYSDPGKKEELSQKIKLKLNNGLAPIGLTVDTDLDVPYDNVLGYLIRLESIKLLIKNALQ